MPLLLRQRWLAPTSLLPLGMALLVVRIWLEIFIHWIGVSLVVVARVYEVPVLVLLPQVVVSHLRLLILIKVMSSPLLLMVGDPLAWR